MESAQKARNVLTTWIVTALMQIRQLELVCFNWDRPALPTVNAGMVIAQGASVCLQTVSHAMDIHCIVLQEIAAQQISTTLHVLEFLLEEAVNSQVNVPEINLVSTENVAHLY